MILFTLKLLPFLSSSDVSPPVETHEMPISSLEPTGSVCVAAGGEMAAFFSCGFVACLPR